MKKKIKTVLTLLLAAMLIVSFASCSDSDDDSDAEKEGKDPVAIDAGDDTDDDTGDDTETVTVVSEGFEGNRDLLLTAFDSYADTALIRLTIRNDSGASRSGWGLGGIGTSDGDDDWGSVTVFDEVTPSGTFDDGDTIEIDTTTTVDDLDTEVTGTKVFFNIFNDCTLLKVSVVE
ncbi:MAG: hypothetical protein PF637_03790 [Spirochaetes bacterium]|jgi:hypothetical protein|nr:hypothetical protein [Spirochaetota bacterium]